MTRQAAYPYVREPEKLSAAQVQAIIDATGVSLEFLRGCVLERTVTVDHDDSSGIAEIFEELNEQHKTMLWSMAVELAKLEHLDQG